MCRSYRCPQNTDTDTRVKRLSYKRRTDDTVPRFMEYLSRKRVWSVTEVDDRLVP